MLLNCICTCFCVCRCCSPLGGNPPPVTLAWSVLGCSATRSAFSLSTFILASIWAQKVLLKSCVCVSSLCVCSTGRILVNERDETSVDNIYAIGSVQHGRPSTTGLSVHSGTLLARRLYRDDNILVHSLEIVTLIVPYSL